MLDVVATGAPPDPDRVGRVRVSGRVGELYHLSPDRGVEVRQVVRTICERMGRRFEDATRAVDERPGQDAAYVIDSTKARTELGWRPTVSLDEGLTDVVDWVNANWAAVVAQLSDVLPDDAHLIGLRMRDDSLALEGLADHAARVFDTVERMPGLVATPTAPPPDEADPFVVLERFHLAIAIVTVIGSTAFLLALMAMRADERRETVGILRLIGFTRRGILLEVLVEGLFIAVAGAVFGVLFATATQGIVNRFFQWRYDTALVFVRVTAPIAARCIVFAVPLGVLAGLVASWTLLRRDIVALLRR